MPIQFSHIRRYALCVECRPHSVRCVQEYSRVNTTPPGGCLAQETLWPGETHLSIYLNQIRQLITLQKVDDEIFVLDKELKAAPQEQEALRARFAEVQAAVSARMKKMEHLHEQEKAPWH